MGLRNFNVLLAVLSLLTFAAFLFGFVVVAKPLEPHPGSSWPENSLWGIKLSIENYQKTDVPLYNSFEGVRVGPEWTVDWPGYPPGPTSYVGLWIEQDGSRWFHIVRENVAPPQSYSWYIGAEADSVGTHATLTWELENATHWFVPPDFSVVLENLDTGAIGYENILLNMRLVDNYELVFRGFMGTVIPWYATLYVDNAVNIENFENLTPLEGNVGDNVSFAFDIVNTGRYPDNYTFTVNAGGWAVGNWAPGDNASLDPGESLRVTFDVTIGGSGSQEISVEALGKYARDISSALTAAEAPPEVITGTPPWIQTTDEDFGIGRGENTRVVGAGANAWVELSISRGDNWVKMANPPANVDYGSCLAWAGENYIYALRGGWKDNFWRYSIVNDNWEILAPVPDRVSWGGSMVWTAGDNLYVLDGLPAPPVNFWRYSISADNWAARESFWGVRCALAWGGGDNIYATDVNTDQDGIDLWRYSISENSWTRLSYKYYVGLGTPTPYRIPLIWTGEDDLYTLVPRENSIFYRYNISENVWTMMSSPGATNSAGASLTYPEGGDYIYLLRGGSTGFGRYSISKNCWEWLSPVPENVGNAGSLAWAGENHIYALKDGSENNFWRYTIPTFVTSGIYTSPVYDAGSEANWGEISWVAGVPENTKLIIKTRTGGTPVPDSGWEWWKRCINGDEVPSADNRYIQYRVFFSTSDDRVTSSLMELKIDYTLIREVEVSIQPGENAALPGSKIGFTVTVKNLGEVDDNYLLEAQDERRWKLKLENEILEVPTGENRQTVLTVTIPLGAQPNTEDVITLIAASLTENVVSGSASCIARVWALVTENLLPTDDIYVQGDDQANTWTGDWHLDQMYVGRNEQEYGDDPQRAWLKFDLSRIPSGVEITEAKLLLYNFAVLGGPVRIRCHGGGDNWSEDNLTWNTQATVGDNLTPPLYLGAKDTGHGWQTWTVTDFVAEQFEDDRIVSFCLIEVNENVSSHHNSGWRTKENLAGAYGPYLQVSYPGVIYGVSVSISPSLQGGTPGSTLTYTVTVTNEGEAVDSFTLTKSDTKGWALKLPSSVGPILPGRSENVSLRVTIPSTAEDGDSTTVTVTATSQENPNVSENAICTAAVGRLALLRMKLNVSEDVWVKAGGDADTWMPGVDDTCRYNMFVGACGYTGDPQRAWLKFDLGDVPAEVENVGLFLYCATVNSADVKIRCHGATDDAWDENSMTWNSAPDQSLTDNLTSYLHLPVGHSGWVSWDVTGFVKEQSKGDKVVSLVLIEENENSGVGHNGQFHQKENPDPRHPYLEIVYWGIDVAPPPAPSLISPVDESINDSTPTFEWSEVSDPSGVVYSLHVDDENTFSPPLILENENIMSTSFTISTEDALDKDGIYYWRVKVTDGAGNENMSDVGSFILDTVPPSTPVITTQLPCETIIPEWRLVGSADLGCKVNIYINRDLERSVETGGEGEFMATITLSEGTNHIEVTAEDVAGNESDPWENTVEFTEPSDFTSTPPFTFTAENGALHLVITPPENVDNIGIAIKYYWENLPKGMPELTDVLFYMCIESKLSNTEGAGNWEIKLWIRKSWLENRGFEPSSVILRRLEEGEWEDLETTYEDEDDYGLYIVSTPSLSYFAVVGGPAPFPWALLVSLVVVVGLVIGGAIGYQRLRPRVLPVPEKVITCPKCGAEVEPGAKFCTSCGATIPVREIEICRVCGREVEPDEQFCRFCGTVIPERLDTCIRCGRRLRPDARFCSYCGAEVPGREGGRVPRKVKRRSGQ